MRARSHLLALTSTLYAVIQNKTKKRQEKKTRVDSLRTSRRRQAMGGCTRACFVGRRRRRVECAYAKAAAATRKRRASRLTTRRVGNRVDDKSIVCARACARRRRRRCYCCCVCLARRPQSSSPFEWRKRTRTLALADSAPQCALWLDGVRKARRPRRANA